ncbi:hypothetical protein BP5796_01943 [Coleophoma crateriformis]|uniref:RRM domain-containing protein n=1 Tax=Coleophoma crateriformis TaxID=565419 RepID=A0A3D8T221_9HELO|nr:hypothetical protein BP5796_01943 [Coleophoma crateriformis]
MLLNSLIPAAYYHAQLSPPSLPPVTSFEVLHRVRFHAILSKSKMNEYSLKYPLHLFSLPHPAEAIFSTKCGKIPKKHLPNHLPAQIVHSDLDGAIVRKANALRDEFTVEVQHVKAPVLFEEIYKYFDGYDLWTEGVIFLYHVLDYIERENVQLDKEFEEMEEKEIKAWVVDWFQRTDEDLIFYTRKNLDLTTLFSPTDALEVQGLSSRQNEILQAHLEKLRRELLAKMSSYDKEDILDEPRVDTLNNSTDTGAKAHFSRTSNTQGDGRDRRYNPHAPCFNSVGILAQNSSRSTSKEHRDISEDKTSQKQGRPMMHHGLSSESIRPLVGVDPYVPYQRIPSGSMVSHDGAVEEIVTESGITLYYVNRPIDHWPPATEARTAYVGGYHEQAIRSHFLRQMFSACGTVEYIKLLTGRFSAFVQFREFGGATRAIDYFDGHTMPNGEILKVALPNSQGDGARRASRSVKSHNQGGSHRASTAIHMTDILGVEPVYYLQNQDATREKQRRKPQNPRFNTPTSTASKTSSGQKRTSTHRRRSSNFHRNNSSTKSTPAGSPTKRVTNQAKQSRAVLTEKEIPPKNETGFSRNTGGISKERSRNSPQRRRWSTDSQASKRKQQTIEKNVESGHATTQNSTAPINKNSIPLQGDLEAPSEEYILRFVDHTLFDGLQISAPRSKGNKWGKEHSSNKSKSEEVQDRNQKENMLPKIDVFGTDQLATSTMEDDTLVKGNELKEVSNLNRKSRFSRKLPQQKKKENRSSNQEPCVKKEANGATGITKNEKFHVKQGTTLSDQTPEINQNREADGTPNMDEPDGLGYQKVKRKTTMSTGKHVPGWSFTEFADDFPPLDPPKSSSSNIADGKSPPRIQNL